MNYLHGSGDLRYKAGAGIALPFAPDSDVGHFLALSSASKIRGFQDDFLWHGRTMSLVAPFRIEYGGRVFFGGDAWLALLLPTSGDDRDAELALALAPGVGFGSRRIRCSALASVSIGRRPKKATTRSSPSSRTSANTSAKASSKLASP